MSISESVAQLPEKTTADVIHKIAATRDERSAAFRLVYDSYLRAGLGEPNEHQMRVTPYHLLPTTEIFIATCDEKVIFTMSLMIDGQLGLPMEVAYGPEIEARRLQGLRLGEVSCLADRRSQFKRFFPIFLRVCRLLVHYAKRRGLDEILLAVHPKHARFYERFMAYQPIGEQTAYPTVRNHPAVALCLNFDRVDREQHPNYELFFGESLPDEWLEPQPIPPEQREFFRPMIDPGFKLAPLGVDGMANSPKTGVARGVA